MRYWNGNVVKTFFGPVDSLDANEVEVFALLIGCSELVGQDVLNLLLKEIFVFATQWGSSKAIYLWQITDQVEVVQDISRNLSAFKGD